MNHSLNYEDEYTEILYNHQNRLIEEMEEEDYHGDLDPIELRVPVGNKVDKQKENIFKYKMNELRQLKNKD